jgi:hypothetical protein
MLSKFYSLVTHLTRKLLQCYPTGKLLQARILIDQELGQRYNMRDRTNDTDNDGCSGCHNCCVADDTDEDDDLEPDGYEPVPGTEKENFYDVWLEFNDLITSAYFQHQTLTSVMDELDFTDKEKQMVHCNLDQDREEPMSARIVRFPILNQKQLDVLRINEDQEQFKITFSLLED